MKNIKSRKKYINENLNREQVLDTKVPERNNEYKYLMEVTDKCKYETTNHFYVKEPIEIGETANGEKVFLNYLDLNEYDKKLSFWYIFGEKPDKLYGTSWESGVIYEEDGALKQTEKNVKISLYPDFITRIYRTIKSYENLDGWIKYIVDTFTKSRAYSRKAMQDSYKKKEDKVKLTWEEKVDWTRNRIEVDKLLNRYKTPYDEQVLTDMLRLGEKEYTDKTDRANKTLMDIIDRKFKK